MATTSTRREDIPVPNQTNGAVATYSGDKLNQEYRQTPVDVRPRATVQPQQQHPSKNSHDVTGNRTSQGKSTAKSSPKRVRNLNTRPT